MSNYLIKNFPDYYRYFSELEFSNHLYLVYYLCKSKNIIDLFPIISKHIGLYKTIRKNYKYIFLKLNIKSDLQSSIIFEYDDIMENSPIISINEYIDKAISLGNKYSIFPHPIYTKIKK